MRGSFQYSHLQSLPPERHTLIFECYNQYPWRGTLKYSQLHSISTERHILIFEFYNQYPWRLKRHFSIFTFTINIQREVRRHPSWHLSAGSGSLTVDAPIDIKWYWTPMLILNILLISNDIEPLLIFNSYLYQMILNPSVNVQ